MEREWMVAGALVALVVGSLVAAIAVPGALADRTEDTPDGDVDIEELSISADQVGGERLDLVTDARLEHWGGDSENVTVEFRAVGMNSGLVEARETVEVGTVTEERELSVTQALRVQRGGDYRINVIVYRDGQRTATGGKSVRGTGALTPGYPDSPVQFHRFTRHDLPVVEYSIQDSTDDRATLSVETYLTNSGSVDADDLRVVVKARQVESGIVATEQEVDIDAVGPSETARPQAELTVPSQYNYYLDAILWKDGVIVDTARAGASLDPTERVPANVSERDVELQIGDFEPGADSPDPPDREEEGTPTPTADGGGPGFGVIGALVALVAALVVTRYRNGGNR